jgi:Flp pilus assembly pilin Flp
MVEYTVILAFGLIVLLGPGADMFMALQGVLRSNYGSYSYAMSMSPLPDFDTGPELEAHIQAEAPDVDDETIARLTVDPVQDAVTTALSPLTSATSAFSDIDSLLGSFEDLGDLAWQMMQDAISPF